MLVIRVFPKKTNRQFVAKLNKKTGQTFAKNIRNVGMFWRNILLGFMLV